MSILKNRKALRSVRKATRSVRGVADVTVTVKAGSLPRVKLQPDPAPFTRLLMVLT